MDIMASEGNWNNFFEGDISNHITPVSLQGTYEVSVHWYVGQKRTSINILQSYVMERKILPPRSKMMSTCTMTNTFNRGELKRLNHIPLAGPRQG
jgi:hypothetical protein